METNNKVAITVGIEERADGTRIDPLEAARLRPLAHAAVLNIAGGLSVSEGFGSWYTERPSKADPAVLEYVLVSERTLTFTAVGQFTREEALEVAESLRALYKQECVTFEFTPAVDWALVFAPADK